MIRILREAHQLALVVFLVITESLEAQVTLARANKLDSYTTSSAPSLLQGGRSARYPVPLRPIDRIALAEFNRPVSHSAASFQLLTGLQDLSRFDFIALDTNNGGGGFESSVWNFSDGSMSRVIRHFYGIPINNPNVLDLDRRNVAPSAIRLFGYSPNQDFGILLFDLTQMGLNPDSPNFTVTIEGESVHGGQTPSPT